MIGMISGKVLGQSNDCVTSGATGQLTVGASCSFSTFNSANNTNYWDGATGCSGSDEDDAWGWFTATSTATTITFDPASNDNPILHLFTGSCATTMTSISCANNLGNSGNETITYPTTVGSTYMVRIQKSNGSQTMNGSICVFNEPAPANDNCGTPTNLTVNPATTCVTSTNGSILGATASPQSDPSCSPANADNDDVWYTFTANGSQNTITLSSITGSSTDLDFSVYSGTCAGTLTEIYCSTGNSATIPGLTNSTVYFVRVYSASTTPQNTNFTICVTTPPPPPANDNCTGATSLTVNPSTTCTTSTTGTVEFATASTQASACAGAAGDDDDVWYSFVATSTAHTVTLSNITGSTTDLDFAVYAASCSGSEILCSQVNTNTASGLTAGVTYFVRVYTATATAGQTTDFTICITTPPAPPANDDCAGATPLSVGASCVYTTYNNNNNATASSGAPAPGCASYIGSDVWFSITVPANGSLQIDTDDVGTITDGGMAAYSGTCGALSLLQCNDDGSANGLMPLITLTGLTPGTTIYIRVWEYGGDIQGNFGICVTSPTPPTPPTPPANNECTTAIGLTVNPGATCTATTAGTIAGATTSAQATGCGGTADDDVWYSFTATATAHTVSLLNVNGSTTDLYHSVYSGTCGSIGTPLICSDPNSSQINGLTVGNTYYVRVYSWTSTTGQTSTFDICLGTPPPPPTNVTCPLMNPICSGSPIAFTAASNGGSAEPGNNYDCLFTQPNPSWYYLEIDQAGNLVIDITAGSDVDYAIWGPYADLTTAKAACGSYPLPVDCSYSASPIEQAVVNTVTSGQVYVLLVTNYANVVQTIFVNEAASNTASTNCAIVPLPVGLSMFNAILKDKKVSINWTTGSEFNTDYFEIQKSRDGQAWQTIKVKIAAGNSTEAIDYSFIDEKPFEGTSYYRLKQVDNDGAFTYSPIRAVNDASANVLLVYPQPASESFTIEVGPMKVTRIYATDLSGKQFELSFTMENGYYSVNSMQLPDGFYHISISDGVNTVNSKLVIQH